MELRPSQRAVGECASSLAFQSTKEAIVTYYFGLDRRHLIQV